MFTNMPVSYVQMLAGAQVNSQNAGGQTALHIAAQNGHTEICRALIENSADPNLVVLIASYRVIIVFKNVYLGRCGWQ